MSIPLMPPHYSSEDNGDASNSDPLEASDDLLLEDSEDAAQPAGSFSVPSSDLHSHDGDPEVDI